MQQSQKDGGGAIPNPYTGSDTYNCFGCAPHNAQGLRMEFTLDGDLVRARWQPRREFEGFPGIVHGGIQAALADETAAWYVHAVPGTAGLTKELHVQYHKPAQFADAPFDIVARKVGEEGRAVDIEVTISGASGTLFSTAQCRFVVFNEEVARKRLGFPGAAAFRPAAD